MQRRVWIAWCVGLVVVAWTSSAWAFKTSMHVRTANVAMLDARDGAICMPGLTASLVGPDEAPPQIPLSNTPLVHFWHGFDAQGQERTVFRNWIIQYAPYVRAGAVGPDGYPDMLSGQLNIHPNTSVPYECTVASSTECYGLHEVADNGRMREGLELAVSQIPLLNSILQFSPPKAAASPAMPTFGGLKETITGKPRWRSIDWAHEILYRAIHYKEEHEQFIRDNTRLDDVEKLRLVRIIHEERRAAVAFALGFFMHMIGDGHVHSLINEIVAMPWNYFKTRQLSNAVYGLMAPMQEEFQHMAIERYLNDSYAPGAEDATVMRHVNGEACMPYVPLEQVNAECLPAEQIVLPPMPCHACNPLRSAEPTDVSDRCDHCFVGKCNPWRELCTAELPPGPICSPEQACDNHARNLAQCAALETEQARAACRRQEERACSEARERCACQRAVKVLVDSKVMTLEQAMRHSCQRPGARTLVAESDLFLGRFDELARADRERAIPAEVVSELGEWARRDAGRCDTRPLDLGYIRANVEEPVEPAVKVMVDGVEVAVPGQGIEQDLNQNGAPDLLNECVWLNCQINPHLCPLGALDRDVDERAFLDVLPCFEPDPEQPMPTRWARRHPDSCAEVRQGEDSIDVDPREVMKAKADSEIARIFLQSTYTLVPKQFVTEFFYMERSYSEFDPLPGLTGQAPRPHVAADFEQRNKPDSYGSFSLGGYPVNVVHGMMDLLRLIDFYVQSALVDPLGLAREMDPGGPLDAMLTNITRLGDLGAGALRRVADALASSPLLNYTFRIPIIGKVVRVEIGRALARPIYALANMVEAVWESMLAEFERGAKRLAVSIGRGVRNRLHNMEGQLRKEWVEATTCMMEAVTSHQDLGYAMARMRRFFTGTAQILVLGGAACQEPMLVKTLRDAEASFDWTMELLGEVGRAQLWVMCEAERILLQELYYKVVEPLMERISTEVITYLACDHHLNLRDGSAFFKSDMDRAKAYEACVEMVEVMTRPMSYTRVIAEPLKQKLLGVPLKIPVLRLKTAPMNVPLINTQVPFITGAEFEIVTLVEQDLYEFMKSMRLILRGACWDGGNSELDVGARDQVRAAFGDFDLRGPDGKHKCAASPQPIQAIAQRVATTYETDNVTPRNSAFKAFDPATWLYPDEEFERRDGPPIIRALDRLMQIADPYAMFTHERPQINFATKSLMYERMHAMNSVAFWPVYNTVQINKLAFMGPGSPTQAPCWVEELECKIVKGRSCAQALDRCQRGLAASHAGSGLVGEGVHAMIFAANLQDPEFVGSGSRGWRPSADVYPDTSLLETGSGALDTFFQEQYISEHELEISHPGYRSCRDLQYNILCNSVYDLDNPDDYCRHAHAWAYEMVEGLDQKDLLKMQVTWPVRDFDTYSKYPEKNSRIFSRYWRIQDHDNCAWLAGADEPALFDYTDSAYALLDPNRKYAPYAPDDERADYQLKLHGNDVAGATRTNLFTDLRDPGVWAYAEHARDYTPHQRSFLVDATQRTLAADALGSMKDGVYAPPVAEATYTPTRFAMANKDKHVSRLYAKTLSPFYCPLAGREQADADCDGVPDLCDNCPQHYNPTQRRTTQRAGYTFAGDICQADEAGVIPPADLRCVRPPPPPADEAAAMSCLGDCQCDTTVAGASAWWSSLWLLCALAWRRRRRG
jgi:hypothetical protein